MDRLAKRYSGNSAIDYDQARQNTTRWKRENEVFTRFFASVKPDSVLDCPFGTGRWIEWYRDIPGPIIAIDKSHDMLREAKKKVTPSDDRYTFLSADALEYEYTIHSRERIDLLVCVRFLNWLSWERARLMLKKLSEARAKFMIVGVTVSDAQTPLERLRRSVKHSLRAALDREATSKVHDRSAFLQAIDEDGWLIRDVCQIFKRGTSVNYLYCVERRQDL